MAEQDGTKTGEGEKGEAKPTEPTELELAKAEAEKWKAMSRKHEAQAKENADAAKKLKDAEDASKTDAERTAARIAELETKVNASDLRAMKAEVAASKSLTPAQARRLTGTTVEELEADADDLLASFKPAATDGEQEGDKPTTGKPKEKMRAGATSPEMQPEEDLAKVLGAIPRA